MNLTIAALIDAERERQREKWGGVHSWGEGDCSSPLVLPIVKSAVLAEECGEVARAVLDSSEGLQSELVQVAAIAVAWLESLMTYNPSPVREAVAASITTTPTSRTGSPPTEEVAPSGYNHGIEAVYRREL